MRSWSIVVRRHGCDHPLVAMQLSPPVVSIAITSMAVQSIRQAPIRAYRVSNNPLLPYHHLSSMVFRKLRAAQLPPIEGTILIAALVPLSLPSIVTFSRWDQWISFSRSAAVNGITG
jgi:hypothetical protein